MRKARVWNPPSQEGISPMAPTRISKQEFARRLYRAMQAKGWSQSDLARAAFGTTEDVRGYTVPRRRDSVSSYLAGRSVPDMKSRAAMAHALGVPAEELLPNPLIDAMEQEEPALEFKSTTGHPDKVWLRVNQLVTMEQALNIANILKKRDGAG